MKVTWAACRLMMPSTYVGVVVVRRRHDRTGMGGSGGYDNLVLAPRVARSGATRRRHLAIRTPGLTYAAMAVRQRTFALERSAPQVLPAAHRPLGACCRFESTSASEPPSGRTRPTYADPSAGPGG